MLVAIRQDSPAMFIAVLCASAAGSCSFKGAGVGADTTACTFDACEAQCRASGLCYGSCASGACNCTDECGTDTGDADVHGDVRDVTGDADAAENRDGDTGASDVIACEFRSGEETRPGASPGVTCVRVSVEDVEQDISGPSGDGDRVILNATGVRSGREISLWEYDRTTGCVRMVDNGEDIGWQYRFVQDTSVEGDRVTYVVEWRTPEQEHCQLRLADLVTGDIRVLDEGTGTVTDCSRGGCGCSMDYPALRYPWVVWRDVREDDGHPRVGWGWYVLALNIETGEKHNISLLDPDDPGGYFWEAVRVDLHGTTATWTTGDPTSGGLRVTAAVDVATLVHTRVGTPQMFARKFATITPEWIAWVDYRAGCPDWFECRADIYGYNRVTGEEVALVVAGETYQGPEVDGEGPWIAYEDQRDGGGDENYNLDGEQDVFALHLPTMTEIKITDWPRRERYPRVYHRGDGTYGVLVVHEISIRDSTYRLWDCDLPEP